MKRKRKGSRATSIPFSFDLQNTRAFRLGVFIFFGGAFHIEHV